MSVCLDMCIYVSICLSEHAYVCMLLLVCLSSQAHVCLYPWVTFVCACMYILSVCPHMHTCVSISFSASLYMHMYAKKPPLTHILSYLDRGPNILLNLHLHLTLCL